MQLITQRRSQHSSALRLEVVTLFASDVDRAKRFYQSRVTLDGEEGQPCLVLGSRPSGERAARRHPRRGADRLPSRLVLPESQIICINGDQAAPLQLCGQG